MYKSIFIFMYQSSIKKAYLHHWYNLVKEENTNFGLIWPMTRMLKYVAFLSIAAHTQLHHNKVVWASM